MMAAGLIPAIAGLGAAIDTGRMYVVKSQLQTGVDAAALAGARAFAVTDGSSSSRTAQVNAYFYGNFPDDPAYMGVTDLVLTPTFEVRGGINLTTVRAEATLPMSFMRAFGFDDTVIKAVAKAELQPRPLEAMVVLDDTGSMKANLSGGRTRMTALKEAASDFVNILHQGADSRRDLAIGFIGYDVTVNVGGLLPASAVAPVEGFNSFSQAAAWGITVPNYASGNFLAWKGCVMADQTVRDVNATRTTSEPGAWDLVRSLPGEGSHPRVQPYFVPPMYVPKATTGNADPTSNYYNIANVEPDNNLYRLDRSAFGTTGADYLVRTELYRQYLYDYYIGLNNGAATATDDVIRRIDGSYYTPSAANRAANDWVVNWQRIPHYYDATHWLDPASARVNANGGITDNGNQNTTPMPSPNWQCPEPAMPVAYGRQRSAYLNHIANDHGAIYPANGTIHHAGLLWGYRLLVRDDVFTRSNPTNEAPRRAIVFMTDGVNEIGESQNGFLDRTFTWYGRWSDSRIAANQSNTETQMLRRFEKVCANIQREANPPEVYIIALVANSTAISNAFNACAPGRVYRTSSTDELRRAFQDVAAELVDLHLVQ
ncbi:Tad domain-containing protein [Sphingomonas japonica]|nr:Tad domain-containing protein [Sphingomonas japonica]